ncbi:MAG: glycoside hydrolase family 13 protein [Bacteroidales bacterium]|nr:glycoside hydrolase family 13 protein [Bacteroidales bacterium]
MRSITVFLFILFSFVFVMCEQKPEKKKEIKILREQPPSWAKDAIWYQIFVERFNNGDRANDPRPENMYAASNYRHPPADWAITPWTQNWYKQEDWTKNLNTDFYGGLGLRRYGGDLQGVLGKLDYLQELGVTAIYFNPLNDAPSLHKYDARNYRHIDVNFGPDPQGDNQIIASEIPDDPATWKWTAADKLFLKLVDELHKRGMRVILDYSWNHTGVEFWAWKDLVKNQEKSKYKDWYAIKTFDDPETEENEFAYHGWLDLQSLPEIKKVNLKTKRVMGHPYEGDINKGAKQHIYEVTKRWLAPQGDVSKGIDGFRLDVADHIGLIFWRDWRKFVKSVNPEAYLVGEIWWEKWPDKLMNPAPYLKGDVFDAVMFYQVYRPARSFFGLTDDEIDAGQFKDSLEFQWNRLQKETVKAMMNTAATHDSPRLLTSFANPTKYKYHAKPNENPDYLTGKPGEETYQRVKLYLIHQFTIPGAPHIWNGDEMGMWGADDPDCRKPLWWPEFDFEPEYRNNFQPGEKEFDEVGFNREHFEFYKKLIRIRKENPVLMDGDLNFLAADKKWLVYERVLGDEQIIVVFNLGKKTRTFSFPQASSYLNLLDGNAVEGSQIRVQPLGAGVFRRVGSKGKMGVF